ncbi:MAG: flagellar biosynthesis anti-sigma factor FlgM [Planctomycetes bacterium]|nr:flagellar biosynthesis anti-sigma factor FlgM [Planctomycetota bacterium]
MSVLILFMDGSIAVSESITSSIAYAFGHNERSEITPPVIASLPKVRRNKIIRVRQQLANGTYDLDERLDAVLERILMDITLAQRRFP